MVKGKTYRQGLNILVSLDLLYKALTQLIALLEERVKDKTIDPDSLRAAEKDLEILKTGILEKMHLAFVAEHRELTLVKEQKEKLVQFEEFVKGMNRELAELLENIREKRWSVIPQEQEELVQLWQRGSSPGFRSRISVIEGTSLNVVEMACRNILNDPEITRMAYFFGSDKKFHKCKEKLDLLRRIATQCLQETMQARKASLLSERDIKALIERFDEEKQREVEALNKKGTLTGTDIDALASAVDHLKEMLKQFKKAKRD